MRGSRRGKLTDSCSSTTPWWFFSSKDMVTDRYLRDPRLRRNEIERESERRTTPRVLRKKKNKVGNERASYTMSRYAGWSSMEQLEGQIINPGVVRDRKIHELAFSSLCIPDGRWHGRTILSMSETETSLQSSASRQKGRVRWLNRPAPAVDWARPDLEQGDDTGSGNIFLGQAGPAGVVWFWWRKLEQRSLDSFPGRA